MKIIDAHLHFYHAPHFDQIAVEAGHKNTAEHLLLEFERLQIVGAIAMGSGPQPAGLDYVVPKALDLSGKFDVDAYNQPECVYYCAGVDSKALKLANMQKTLDAFEQHLKTEHCVGLKMYPGYNDVYVFDDIHAPLYELAAHYDMPVVIHTGDTSQSSARVKFAHPLTVDEVAVKFPKNRFVMAHYGNPWIVDATEVVKKNPNVCADLSGIAQGKFKLGTFLETYGGFVELLRTWTAYLGDYSKLLFGTDWPLVNIQSYIDLIAYIIPEKSHEQVFYKNAKRVFTKLNIQ